MRVLRATLFFLTVFCLCVVFSRSLSANDTLVEERGHTPYPLNTDRIKDVVENFCELDAQGQRLQGDTWSLNVAPLITWPEEAGDMIFVISSYEVGKAEILNSKARVSVKYRYLGSTNFIDFSSPGKDLRQERIVVFELARIDGTWKIKGPITAPHVNWKVVIADLKAL